MVANNEKFFERVDSEVVAYFLGLMYADGSNSSQTVFKNSCKGKQVSISLQEEDVYILKQLKDLLNCPASLSFLNKHDKNPNWKNMYTLTISGKKISEDLEKLGCMANKTTLLQFPNDAVVPNKYLNHFIRGYFDGDGCIYNGKRKIHLVKDSKYPSGYRNKVIQNTKFQITGNINFIDKLQDVLIENVELGKTKLNSSKSKQYVTMEYVGRQSIKKVYSYLYSDATIYLTRKKEKFLEILNCANIQ